MYNVQIKLYAQTVCLKTNDRKFFEGLIELFLYNSFTFG